MWHLYWQVVTQGKSARPGIIFLLTPQKNEGKELRKMIKRQKNNKKLWCNTLEGSPNQAGALLQRSLQQGKAYLLLITRINTVCRQPHYTLNRAGYISRQRLLGVSLEKHLVLNLHLPSTLLDAFHLSCYSRIRPVPINFQNPGGFISSIALPSQPISPQSHTISS